MSNSRLYERYSRQIILKELGEAGQVKLLQSKVLVIGAGGLGCAALQYLTAAGIGTLGIIDDDVVALHNLHRQVLYSVGDIDLPKSERAAFLLRQLNPDIIIEAFNEKLTATNALALIGKYDIIIDCTDNFSSRYIINDACVLMNKTFVYGAVSKYEGQVAVFNHVNNNQERSVNYRDLFPLPPAAGEIADCEEAGVLGVLPGIIGTMQAGETIKLITGIGKPLLNRMLTFNLLNNQLYEVAISLRPATRDLIPRDAGAFEQTDYDRLCGITKNNQEINPEEFDALRTADSVLIIDVREDGEQPLVNEFPHLQSPLSMFNEQFKGTENETIIVFCQSGKRSAQAVDLLNSKFGYSKKIFSLAGGIIKWKEAQAHKIK